MKNIKTGCTIVALIALQHGFAQQSQPGKQFILEGRLSGQHTDSVSVNYADANGKYIRLALPVTDQKFAVSGYIDGPVAATLIFKNAAEVISREQMESKRIIVYLEPKKMSITGDASKPKTMKISGSKSQSDYEELNRDLADVNAEKQPIIDELMKEKDHEKQAEIREKLAPYNNRIKKIKYQFFLSHPNSYVTADQIKYDVASLSLDSTKRIYNNFNAELIESNAGKYLANEIKKIEAGMPGNIAPDFTTTDIEGKPLSLSGFKGKYVILDFWASWCVPCRKGNPHMIAVFNQYHARGLEMIGVSDDDSRPQAWKPAVEKDKIGIWHHVLRGLDMQLITKRMPNPKDINAKYGIHTLPTKILIDPSGKIIGRYGDSVGGTDEDLDKMIAGIFKN